MAEPFIGEIRMFTFSRVPSGWAPCNGQLLQIQQNRALFSILGTLYGGDGTTTFALPNLQGRVPLGPSPSVPIATAAGEANHVLTTTEMPQHTHTLGASSQPATTLTAANNVWAASSNRFAAQPNTIMAANALMSSGGSAAHSNMQPYTVGNYCIALMGIYPPRN